MHAQCDGITKSGSRCKNTAGLIDGYCKLHREQRVKNEKPEPIKKAAKDNKNAESEPASRIVPNVNKNLATVLLLVTAIISFFTVVVFRRRR